jgi:glycosidase
MKFKIGLKKFQQVNFHLPPTFYFHISKECRKKYSIKEELFSITGNIVFANIRLAKDIAHKMNQKKNLTLHPEQTIRAGLLNAMALEDEIFHYVLGIYKKKKKNDVFKKAIEYIEKSIGKDALSQTLVAFVDRFPPPNVYKGNISPEKYIEQKTQDVKNSEIVLEEMFLVFLANDNPAFELFLELFDDKTLEENTPYQEIIRLLHAFLEKQPKFGPYNQNIPELLKSPVVAHPRSITGQLMYIKEHWGMLLSEELFEKLLHRLLVALDIIKEEEKIPFLGAAETFVPCFKKGIGLYDEYERYSTDLDWMSNVVLIAKNTYVWLDQLSKKYSRPISTLDAIPDEELDSLAQWGFTGLWLIGVWERSPASRKIKQMTGNPEAHSSAYSIYGYTVANELGSEQEYERLKIRALQRGIRIAVDMVPNHFGIYSKWVIEHPDYFLQLAYPAFPKYQFNGPDLSDDKRVGIFIEDGYWNRTDAAVVFKRLDRWTGDVRYIYHGNDGTNMPWNDTAQLNFLISEVRESVIQQILNVARKSSIIRFDAAMTLAKRHYKRLWFPEPGTGGDIPSRAEHSITSEEFEHLFPVEFWRDVVDRVAKEAPETLLLAEAFWLMEGYFVRTLGMHRVYNSAFMNMLKNEENSKYRNVIKNVMEFDKEILKRFVNFMNNPDEIPAAVQFGKDDKYFGIAVMMVTMPGLPMFGHGQIEGFSEKYGMEYRKAYLDEKPDTGFIERHKREIFPLLKKRTFFSGVENFVLYDLYREDGKVNENIFAYSNRHENERALVVYNNKYEKSCGWIKTSAAYMDKKTNKLIRKDILESLGFECYEKSFLIFKEHITGMEYIRKSGEIKSQGLYIELDAFKYAVFMDFKQVEDTTGDYENIEKRLNGKPHTSIEQAISQMRFEPVRNRIKDMLSGDERSFGQKFKMFLDGFSKLNPADIEKTFNKIKRYMVLKEIKKTYIAVKPEIIVKQIQFGFENKDKDIGHILATDEIKEIIQCNYHNNTLWFNKESFEGLLYLMYIIHSINKNACRYKEYKRIINLAKKTGYRYEEFITRIGKNMVDSR